METKEKLQELVENVRPAIWKLKCLRKRAQEEGWNKQPRDKLIAGGNGKKYISMIIRT